MADPNKNFIIQYARREGSSAIISALSAQKGVNVPLFEELDAYKFEKIHSKNQYPQAIDSVFSTGQYAGPRTRLGYLQAADPNGKILTTGFKWRVAGKLADVAKVLLKHNVTVFLLLRRDFLSMTCSEYVHKHGNRLQSETHVPTHPQFTHNQDEATRSALLKQLSQQDFRLIKPLFLHSAYTVSNIRKRQVRKARLLARAGVPVRLIYYEDFDADQKAFIVTFLAKIGVDISQSYTPFCRFEKVHKRPISERIGGVDHVASSRLFRYFRQEFDEAPKFVKENVQP